MTGFEEGTHLAFHPSCYFWAASASLKNRANGCAKIVGSSRRLITIIEVGWILHRRESVKKQKNQFTWISQLLSNMRILFVVTTTISAFRAPFLPSFIPKGPMVLRMGGDEYGASSTSFYTTTEKQDSYDDLDSVLDHKCKDQNLRKLICECLDACGEITEALRSALVTVEGR